MFAFKFSGPEMSSGSNWNMAATGPAERGKGNLTISLSGINKNNSDSENVCHIIAIHSKKTAPLIHMDDLFTGFMLLIIDYFPITACPVVSFYSVCSTCIILVCLLVFSFCLLPSKSACTVNM